MFRLVICSVLLSLTASGCGKQDGPQLAEALGTVTYKGQPVDAANVVFVPDAGGPAAYGMTDKEGKFALTTGGEPGAMVGTGKVAITAYVQLDEPKEEEDLTEEDLKKMSESRIPEKYGRVETSGLTATISADSDNSIPFDLTD